MYKMLVLVVDDLMDSSLALTLDTVATANRVAAARGQKVRLSTTLFHPGRRRVRTGMGATLSVEPEVRIKGYDALIVPGLGLATRGEIEAFFAGSSSRKLVDWLKKTGSRCPLVAASCSAVFLLAEAGLLTNQPATTSWWHSATFRERYPEVELDESRMLVDSPGRLCAGAALAQIDLMLHLIAKAASPDLSREVSRYLAIDERPSQARYMMLSAMAGLSGELSAIERWIRTHRSRPFPISEMAKALGMSTRTLDRRVRAATGQGASRFVQRLRLEHAAHLIETSELPLQEIADQVGYRDASTLRRLMRRNLGVNPSELRKRSA